MEKMNISQFDELADKAHKLASKPIKDTDRAIIGAMLARFKAIPFKNGKQMVSFRNTLVEEMNKHIIAQTAGWNAKKQKANQAKLERDRVQMEICGRWAKASLPIDAKVKVRGSSKIFQVLKIEPEGVMVVELKKQILQGVTCYAVDANNTVKPFPYEKLHKLEVDGVWTDIYDIASGLKELK